jgi:guanidinobutyrase / D-arginase
VDGRLVPRFAGSATFARLPEIDRVSGYDVAILGVPFDNGTSYRPGARFGPGQAAGLRRARAGGERRVEHVDVEVAPAYDHAEITSIAAATVVYDLLTLLARRHAGS